MRGGRREAQGQTEQVKGGNPRGDTQRRRQRWREGSADRRTQRGKQQAGEGVRRLCGPRWERGSEGRVTEREGGPDGNREADGKGGCQPEADTGQSWRQRPEDPQPDPRGGAGRGGPSGAGRRREGEGSGGAGRERGAGRKRGGVAGRGPPEKRPDFLSRHSQEAGAGTQGRDRRARPRAPAGHLPARTAGTPSAPRPLPPGGGGSGRRMQGLGRGRPRRGRLGAAEPAAAPPPASVFPPVKGTQRGERIPVQCSR